MTNRYIHTLKNGLISTITILLFSYMPLYATAEDEIPVNSEQNITEAEKKEENNEEIAVPSTENIPEEESEYSSSANSIDGDGTQRENTQEDIEKIPQSDVSIKKEIQNEKAIESSEPMFPSKKELKKEEISSLSTMEILKELESASSLFSKRRLIAKNDENKNEETGNKNEKESIEESKKEEKTENTEVEEEVENKEVEENIFTGEDFSIEDFDDEEEYEAEEIQPGEEDNFLTFDEEVKKEKESTSDSPNNTSNPEVMQKDRELSNILDEDDKVNISRYANILKGQAIDFSYPGEGWVYLGEENTKKGLEYKKRKMSEGKTFFTFKAEKVGNYILNFSYFDVFSGNFIVDAISVKVIESDGGEKKDSLTLEYNNKDKPNTEKEKKSPSEVGIDGEKVEIKIEDGKKLQESVGKVQEDKKDENTSEKQLEKNKPAVAKEEKKAVEATTADSSTKQTKNSQYQEPEVFVNVATITPENAKTKENSEEANKIIKEAQDAISQNDAKTALEKLESFFNISSSNIDVAYFLRGMAYEINGEYRNMKQALSAYKFLIKTFPNSSHYEDAMRRIRYIEKYFVNIK